MVKIEILKKMLNGRNPDINKKKIKEEGKKTPIYWQKPPSKMHTTQPTIEHLKKFNSSDLLRLWIIFLFVSAQWQGHRSSFSWFVNSKGNKHGWSSLHLRLAPPPPSFYTDTGFWLLLALLTAASAAHRDTFRNQRTRDNQRLSAKE